MSTERSDDHIRTTALQMTRELRRRVTAEELRRRVGLGAEDQIERLVARGLVARVPQSHRTGERNISPRKSDRFDERVERWADKAERWFSGLARSGTEITESEAIEQHRQRVERKARQEIAALRGHRASFLGVQAMLFVIWFLTTAPGFPWFLIPLAGWGIGYVTHHVGAHARQAEQHEVAAMKRPSLGFLGLHRKLWKNRRGFRAHVASTGMVSVLLATINIITGGGFPWAFIPIAGLGIGVFSHYGAYRARERKILEQMETTGREAGPGLRVAAPDPRSPDNVQATQLRDAILEKLESLPGDSAMFDADFHQSLNRYVDQVTHLSSVREELSHAVASIPIDDLDTDRARLVERRDAAASERIKSEYGRSIEQIDRQKQSFAELVSEQEMADLRVTNALNSLRQLHLDLTRMKSITPADGEEALETLRTRAEDLGHYITDLKEGYEELDGPGSS